MLAKIKEAKDKRGALYAKLLSNYAKAGSNLNKICNTKNTKNAVFAATFNTPEIPSLFPDAPLVIIRMATSIKASITIQVTQSSRENG